MLKINIFSNQFWLFGLLETLIYQKGVYLFIYFKCVAEDMMTETTIKKNIWETFFFTQFHT